VQVADGGLVSNNLVFRYNVETTKDGQIGEEGTFSIGTFWAVEALARLGQYKTEYLEKARLMFEQTLGKCCALRPRACTCKARNRALTFQCVCL
jgi:GH15 family glucan-1,4-alpha-glucosidase